MTEELESSRGVYERKDEVQILDVREQAEWDEVHIPGSTLIPYHDIRAVPDELDSSTPVAVICRSGNRSELAHLMLRARGFDAYNVRDGMEGWDREGLPYSAPDGSPGRVA